MKKRIWRINEPLERCIFCWAPNPWTRAVGIFQCPACGYNGASGHEGPKTYSRIKVHMHKEHVGVCMYCKKEASQAWVTADCLIFDPVDVAVLADPIDRDEFSDFVRRRRKGHMCSECGLVNWTPDGSLSTAFGPFDWTAPTELYARLMLDEIEGVAEEIPKIPKTWRPGLVTCSPSLYVAGFDLSR